MGVELVGLMIPLSVVLGCIFLGALWIILRGGSRKENRAIQAEETRLIQDIYHGLIKMEERVEALETLLLERERKGGGVS